MMAQQGEGLLAVVKAVVVESLITTQPVYAVEGESPKRVEIPDSTAR